MNALNNVLAAMAVAAGLSGITAGAWLSEPTPVTAPSEPRAALTAAAAWLAEVDAGRYGASWAQAAELFRNAVKKAQWEQQLGAARAPFGALVSRQARATQRAKSLPGAPDGDYVVIEYAASFAHKQQAVETVTLLWNLAGVQAL